MQNFFDSNNQHEILERIFSLSLGLLCITYANGQFLKVNSAWEKAFGSSANELLYKNLVDFTHPNDLDATVFAIEKLISQNDVLNFANRYRSKTGVYRNIEWEFRRYGDYIYIAGKDISQPDISEASGPAFNKNSEQEQDSCRSNCQLKNRQRILIVDDSLLNTKILEQSLKRDYDIQIANSGVKALSIVYSHKMPDLILLDIIMPDMNGYQVLKKLHQDQRTKDIPIIFLTSLDQAENQEYGLKLGAIDYITKPFNVGIVKAKIKNHLATKHYQDTLKISTDVDQLTRIANRRRFDEMLSLEIKKSKQMNQRLSLLMIDIDHFKLYNDTYGHLEGDECLRKVASTLDSSLQRPEDLAARWGGEEFTCLLPDTDEKDAGKIAESLRKAVLNLEIPHASSPVKKVVTISVGVATADSWEKATGDTLLKNADKALYKAKASGRNRISA